MPKYQVNITAVSDRAWSAFGKALQIVAGLGWLDARRLSRYLLKANDSTEELVHLPCVLVAGIDRATADHVAVLLREAGATVGVEESTVQQPMLLCPKANQRYRWDDLLAKPVADQPLPARRRVTRQIVWTALRMAWITAVLSGIGVESAPAEGSKLVWVTSWSLYGAVLGAGYGAIWGLLKGIGRLSGEAKSILVVSYLVALVALHTNPNKPWPGYGFSVESTLGRAIFGAICAAIIAGVGGWLGNLLLRLMGSALQRLFRGGRTA